MLLRYFVSLGVFSTFLISCNAKTQSSESSTTADSKKPETVTYSQDMRPVDGALHAVSLKKGADDKYELIHKVVSSGFGGPAETKETVIGKDLSCEFASEGELVANCLRFTSTPGAIGPEPAFNVRMIKTAELSEENSLRRKLALKLLINTPEAKELKGKLTSDGFPVISSLEEPTLNDDDFRIDLLPNKDNDKNYVGAFYFTSFVSIE